ncbi:MAG: hypothetical protein QM673_16425 [Gordonia sp. (in: high G+C Gram-positive bacteria)]
MLSLALGATLVGFVLLVVGLITGTVWLAVGCIVVCLVGLVFLVIDVLRSGNSDARRSDLSFSAAGYKTGEHKTDGHKAGEHKAGETETVEAETDEHAVADESSVTPGEDPTPQQPGIGDQAVPGREGNYHDYLRSVTGSLRPIQVGDESSTPSAGSPSGRSPQSPSTGRIDPLDPQWRPPHD